MGRKTLIMNYDSLSERQRAILTFIQKHQNETGFPPTIREIGEACSIPSTSVVNYNLNKLVDGSFITRTPDKSRGIRLNKDSLRETAFQLTEDGETFSIPMVGKIVAGAPVWPGDSGSYVDETLSLPRELLGNIDSSQVYALRVSGHSMIDAMVDDGDVVILKRQEVAKNGDMVAAWLTEKNETTLKHFYDEGNRVRLQPRNPNMQPIFVDKDKVQVQGRVLAVFRKIN
jgi:repressor LexA